MHFTGIAKNYHNKDYKRMDNSYHIYIVQRRWLSNYNKRIREEVGAELKKRLKMKAFYWMMMKTATIPETSSSSQDFFPDYSYSPPSGNSSATRQFHVLVVIVTVFHIVISK